MDVLINVKKLHQRMGLPADAIDDTKGNLKMAIISAQIYLQAQLATSLQKTSVVDHFYLNDYANSGVRPGGYFALSLSNGFLRDTPAPAFEYADFRSTVDEDWTAFANESGSTAFTVDTSLGRVGVHEIWAGKWVRARYDAGFQAGDTLPDWLTEGISALVPVVLQYGQMAISQGGDLPDKAKAAVDHAMNVVRQYKRRTHGIVIRPS